MEYVIYVNGKVFCSINGDDIAGTMYVKSCKQYAGEQVQLISGSTGELLADNSKELWWLD